MAYERARLWAPVAAWCALIFFFSHQSGSPDGSGPFGLGFAAAKLGHLIGYAVLWRLSWRALKADFAAGPAGWAAFAFCVLYAAADEWHQSFVPYRNARLTDVLIDAVGAGLGAMLRRR